MDGRSYYRRIERPLAALFAIQWVMVAATSTVVDVGLFGGRPARVAIAVYVVVLAGIVIRPSTRWLHRVALPLAMICFGGRAVRFLQLVLELDRTDLWGSVAERVTFTVFVAIFHTIGILRGDR